MPEAHVVRQVQQDKFVEDAVEGLNIFLEAMAEAIEEPDPMKLGAKIEAERAANLKAIIVLLLGGNTVQGFRHIAVTPCVTALEEHVREFARAPEEVEALRYRLIERFVASLAMNAENALLRLAMSNPQQIFHAPSGMTDMDL